MNQARYFFHFMRVRQYYKNIIIFLPLVFAIKLFSPVSFLFTVLGFISLCLVSSALYVRNDILDMEVDRLHPRKSKRPLPAGVFSIKQAQILFAILIVCGFSLSFFLDWHFSIVLLLLFLNTEVYSHWTKKIAFLDVFAIGINFVIRAVSGIILIKSPLSPWLILGVFFVSLFLGFTKRKAEYESLNENGKNHRISLQGYSQFSLNSVVIISAVMIIITYSLYAMEGPTKDWRLVLTVPMIMFVIFRQLHLSSINDEIAQTNEIFADRQSAIATIVYVAATIYLIYFAPNGFFSIR